MKYTVIGLAILVAVSGCNYSNRPFIVHNAAGEEFRLDHHSTKDDIPYSALSGPTGFTLRLPGTVECMSIDSSGEIIAIVFWSKEGPNEYGGYYSSNVPDLIIVNADTLTIRHRWPVTPPDGDASDIVRFDKIAISHNHKLIATYYWNRKPGQTGGNWSVVTLWDISTGKWLREFASPAPDALLKGLIHTECVTGLTFSCDDKQLAVAGCWPIKQSPPDIVDGSLVEGFFAVHNVDGSNSKTFRTVERSFTHDWCFDGTGKRLACWSWASTSSKSNPEMDIIIWSAITGKQMSLKKVPGRIQTINWDAEEKAFVARLTDGRTYSMP